MGREEGLLTKEFNIWSETHILLYSFLQPPNYLSICIPSATILKFNSNSDHGLCISMRH